jgi:class 3 adenylate cyclase
VAELHRASAEGAYRLLAGQVSRSVRYADVPLSDRPVVSAEVTNGTELVDTLIELLRSVRRLGRLQMVFLFDEIERVLVTEWGGGFLAHWRMLLNNMGELSRCVSAVFSGAREIYQLAYDAGSPLGNILAWHELDLFNYDETARMVREPSGFQWPEALIARVFEVSGGHPCLIQYLMQRVCDRDAEQWSDTIVDAEQRFLREHTTIFWSWWGSFDEPARAIYAGLAGGGIVPEGDVITRFSATGKRALDVLAHTGVVRWDRGARTVQMAGTLFQTWAEENALPGRQMSRQTTPVVADAPTGAASPAASDRRIATVLFTDIVDSTRMTAALGDRRWLDVVNAHNQRVRAALTTFRGREVKTTGDGFLALFDAPTAAIQCASAIVRAVRPLGFEVRAGLHAGEYHVVGDDVFGIAINYASWVMSQARGSEVIVSDTVRGLVAGSGIVLIDRGARRVKGSRERHRLFAVDHTTLPKLPSLL